MSKTVYGHLPSILAALAGTALTAAAFYGLVRYQRQRVEYEFERDAANRVQAVRHAMEMSVGAVESLAALYAASSEVEHDEFNRFVRPLLAREPGLRAMAWAPMVSRSDRARFVRKMQAAVPGFRIRERAPDGRLVPAAARPFYLPVLYEAPLAGNKRAIGFDSASEARRRKAAERARDTGKPAATTRVRLVQGNANGYTFIVFVPVYRHSMPLNTVAQRRAAFSGVVAGIYRSAEIVERSLSYLEPASINLRMYQGVKPAKGALLYYRPANARQGTTSAGPGAHVDDDPGSRPRKLAHFMLAGLPWTLLLTPGRGAYATDAGWPAWATLAAGLAFTLLAVLYLEGLRSRALELNAEIADRKRTESSLHLFQSLINRFGEVVYIVDPASARFLYVNRAGSEALGYDRDALLALRAIDVAGAADHPWSMDEWESWVKGLETNSFQIVEGMHRRSDGTRYPVEINASLIEEEGQKFIVAIAEDITELKQEQASLKRAKADLERLSREDGLTGIANRRHFDEYLAEEWERAARNGTELSVVIADIDHFKDYNDCYGHLAGDNCLRRIAQAFSAAVERPADLVARFGGEELAVVLPETSAAGARRVAEKIRCAVEALGIAHRASGVSSIVTISLGVGTAAPRENGASDGFLHEVDGALYRAKQHGRNRTEVLRSGRASASSRPPGTL